MRYRHRAGLSLGVLLWGTAAWGATYYSAPSGSGTACSQEAPCSLGTGTSTLRPGDTLYLRGGTYNDGINPGVGGLASGSGESSRTTIAGYPGEMPVLTRLNLGEGGGFSWMTFSGLRIEGGGVFLGGDTHHIRVQQSDIAGGRMGISGSGGFHEFIGNQIHGAEYYGTYWSGHDTVFDGNDIYDNGGYGVHVFNTGHTDVSNNVIRNNRIIHNGIGEYGPGLGGVVVAHGTHNVVDNNMISENFAGVQVDYGCESCEVTNNTITNNRFHGIQVGSRASNTVLRNNLLSGNGSEISDFGSATAQADNGTGAAGASAEPRRDPLPASSGGGGPAPRPTTTPTAFAAANP